MPLRPGRGRQPSCRLYICDQDHVVLNAPEPGPQHVLTKTLPAQVI